jgi:adenosylcobinamide kinase/adenosylcobinamide-phosphate guanylyltransferase
MGRLILILGGARSGKSAYAQRLAQELGAEKVLFVATAEAGDEEMAQRIARHRQARPATWRTVEAPRHVGEVVRASLGNATVVLVDCLTLLVSNAILALGIAPNLTWAEAVVQEEIKALLQGCQASTATYIVVSNEVGLGLVPDTPLGRVYRDLLGQANQALAAQAQAVYLMVAGLAVDCKALALAHGSSLSLPETGSE